MNTTDEADIQDKNTGRRRSCLGCLGRGAIGLVIFLVIGLAIGLIYQAAASASDLKKYLSPGELYDVGGYRLHLYCTGTGGPTVILEAGAGLPALTWYLVQKEVGGFARVCSYDRPGFGWSDTASGPLSPAQVAADLHKLLELANVSGPYILVGHSAGGFYVRAYATRYPSEVAGLVLVDAVHEDQDVRYPPEYVKLSNNASAMMPFCQFTEQFGWMRALKSYDALIPGSLLPPDVGEAALSTLYRAGYCKAVANEAKAVASFRAHPDLPRSLGNLPLVVLSAGISAEEGYAQLGKVVQFMISREIFAKVHEANQELQKDLVGLSTQGKQVIATESGHLLQYDQPDLVIDAIRSMVEQLRGK